MKKLLLALCFGILSTTAYADDYDDVIKLTATVAAYHMKCEKIEKQYKETVRGFSAFTVLGDYDQVKARTDLVAENKNQLKKYDELGQDYCNTVKEVLIK